MVKLAKAKKIKRKKIYKKTKKKKEINLKKIDTTQYLKFLGPLFIFLFIVFGVTIVLQKTVFDKTNYIQDINWSKESIKLYDNPYLYKDIQDNLSGRNIYKLNYLGYTPLLNILQKKYPIVNEIEIQKTLPNTVAVELGFIKPNMLFQLQGRKFGVWEGGILEIFSGNTIGNDIFTVELPLYASGAQFIDGIFYDIPQEELLPDLYAINESFPQADRIVYMPGSQTTVIFVYGKKVYINHTHDVSKQINTFYGLEKYYSGFVNINTIDLGSLEEGQTIVR